MFFCILGKNSMSLKSLLFITLTFGIMSMIGIVIITQPSLIPMFDLSSSNSANIGTTIAGITSPLLTLITIYFLYQAFLKQSEGNDFQKVKNDLDLIFLMIADLNSEYDKFEIVENQGSNRNVYTGYIAVKKYCRNLSPYPFQFFSQQMESDYLLYLIKTYTLIKERISIAKLDNHSLELLNEKMQLLFDIKFEVGYREIATAYLMEDDHLAREFISFYNLNSKKKMTLIDLNLNQGD